MAVVSWYFLTLSEIEICKIFIHSNIIFMSGLILQSLKLELKVSRRVS